VEKKMSEQQACSRAFKEWDLACTALRNGRQILLIRKGGIKEEGGVFTVEDKEFLLLPTFDHQNAAMLTPEWEPRLAESRAAMPAAGLVRIDTFARVDSIWCAQNEDQVNALLYETIWNSSYVKLRFDYSPYDPLYLIVLRAYKLPQAVTLPYVNAYGGCKSWITLEKSISTANLEPALTDEEFSDRKKSLLAAIGHGG
jgi:hypothetical protein